MTASTVASPCIDVCEIDADSGWCAGCMRSLDEIAAWGSLDVAAQRAVWKQLPGRRERFAAAQPAGAVEAAQPAGAVKAAGTASEP